MRRKKNSNTQPPTLLSLIIALCLFGYFYVKGHEDNAAVNNEPTTTVADSVPTAGANVAEASDVSDDEETEDTTSVQAPKGIEIPRFTRKQQSQILVRLAYTASYNKYTRCPNWVAWKLTSDHTDGPYVRKGYRFHEDLDVPYPRAYYEDYKGSPYGMQRGHMCPAADNKWSDRAMDECHLLTNICPQYGQLNGGEWKDLEDACRDWANEYGCIYIVCGPIFYSNSPREIGEHDISVPDAFFKVVLRLGRDPQALGFIYPNDRCSGPMSDYVMSVDRVEETVGLDFFSALNDAVESKVERRANLAKWD